MDSIQYKLRDNLKAFNDFKNKQKSAWSNVFWYVKVWLLESVFNTLYIKKMQILRKFLRIKKTVQKMPSFFFRELQLIAVLLLICNSYIHLSKTVCGIFHFQFPFVLLKFIFSFSKMHEVFKYLTLKRHNSFQNENNRKPHTALPPDLWFLCCNKKF